MHEYNHEYESEEVEFNNRRYNEYYANYHGKLNWWYMFIMALLIFMFLMRFMGF